jgi:hypothetical protein
MCENSACLLYYCNYLRHILGEPWMEGKRDGCMERVREMDGEGAREKEREKGKGGRGSRERDC